MPTARRRRCWQPILAPRYPGSSPLPGGRREGGGGALPARRRRCWRLIPAPWHPGSSPLSRGEVGRGVHADARLPSGIRTASRPSPPSVCPSRRKPRSDRHQGQGAGDWRQHLSHRVSREMYPIWVNGMIRVFFSSLWYRKTYREFEPINIASCSVYFLSPDRISKAISGRPFSISSISARVLVYKLEKNIVIAMRKLYTI